MVKDTDMSELMTACEPRMRQPDFQKSVLAIIRFFLFIDPCPIRHSPTLQVKA